MSGKFVRFVIAFSFFTLLSFSGHAIPINWSFDNAVFDDGGTLTGSFVYDRDIDDYSAFNITTTAGSVGAATSYTEDTFLAGHAGTLFFPDSTAADLTGASALSLFFVGGLSNLGGNVPLLVILGPNAGSREGRCETPDCGSVTGFRGIVSGSVIGTPADISEIPVPPALILFATGVLALGTLRRRRVS